MGVISATRCSGGGGPAPGQSGVPGRQAPSGAGAIELGFPHDFLNRPMTRIVTFGDLKIETVAHR
jgi:hypothetical protein